MQAQISKIGPPAPQGAAVYGETPGSDSYHCDAKASSKQSICRIWSEPVRTVEGVEAESLKKVKKNIDVYQTMIEEKIGIKTYLLQKVTKTITSATQTELNMQKGKINYLLQREVKTQDCEIRVQNLRFMCMVLQTVEELSSYLCSRIVSAFSEFLYLSNDMKFESQPILHQAMEEFSDCHQTFIVDLVEEEFCQVMLGYLGSKPSATHHDLITTLFILDYCSEHGTVGKITLKTRLDIKREIISTRARMRGHAGMTSYSPDNPHMHHELASKYLSRSKKNHLIGEIINEYKDLTTKHFPFSRFQYFDHIKLTQETTEELKAKKRRIIDLIRVRGREKYDKRVVCANLLLQCYTIKQAAVINDTAYNLIFNAVVGFVFTYNNYHSSITKPLEQVQIFTECHLHFILPCFQQIVPLMFLGEHIKSIEIELGKRMLLRETYVVLSYFDMFFRKELSSLNRKYSNAHNKKLKKIKKNLFFHQLLQLRSMCQKAFYYLSMLMKAGPNLNLPQVVETLMSINPDDPRIVQTLIDLPENRFKEFTSIYFRRTKSKLSFPAAAQNPLAEPGFQNPHLYQHWDLEGLRPNLPVNFEQLPFFVT